MKRKDAFRKLRTVCQRLDEADPNDFYIIPKKLYLFGSVLTAKPKPNDLDLFLEYEERPDRDPQDLYYRLMYHKPLPVDQAVTHLRKRMQMIRFDCKTYGVGEWLDCFVIPEDVHIRLVWQPELDWKPIVDELEAYPIPWDEEKHGFYKQINERAMEIAKAAGIDAAEEWKRAQLLKYRKRM